MVYKKLEDIEPKEKLDFEKQYQELFAETLRETPIE